MGATNYMAQVAQLDYTPKMMTPRERAHHTLKDRLVKELRLAGISTIEAANAFLPNFVANYNGRFAKPAARDQDFHRSSIPARIWMKSCAGASSVRCRTNWW